MGDCTKCLPELAKRGVLRQKDSDSSGAAGSVAFSYVNITTACCEGWLNLFFGERCIACIDDVELADKIRAAIPEMVKQ